MPFGIGPMELVIILVIVVIVFGVGKLPEIGGALGKGIKEFRGAVQEQSADEAAKPVEARAADTAEAKAKPKTEA